LTIVVVDDKGRIYLPSDIRRKLGLHKGTKLRVTIENGRIVLAVEDRGVKLVRKGGTWGSEAFPDAGEALAST